MSAGLRGVLMPRPRGFASKTFSSLCGFDLSRKGI